MTSKIYYNDSYLTALTSEIQNLRESPDGIWVSPAATIFYPGGGGQLPDKGKINDVEVSDLKEEDGQIWHLLKHSQGFDTQSAINLTLDWNWRYYNMQQHSGQHLISQILWERQLKTVSVHLGEAYTLIEVEGEFPDKAMIQSIENEANRMIRAALPMKSYWVDHDSIGKLPLRKPAGDWENLRVVEIEGIDYSACGGTHVRNTAEIGLVKCTGIEKIRGHARIKFVIGSRAYEYLDQTHNLNMDLKQNLETEPDQFVKKINGFKTELAEQKKEIAFYREEFIKSQSLQIAAENADQHEPLVILASTGNYDDWKQIAKLLANEHGKLVFIIFNNRFVLVVPEEEAFSTVEFLKAHGPALKIRGGGPDGFAQGSIETTKVDHIRAALTQFKENSNPLIKKD